MEAKSAIEKELQTLKEENEKWEYWASEVIHYSHSASLDNLQAKKLITPDNKPTLADVRDFGEEITQLKEENDKLKEMDKLNCGLIKCLNERNRALKKKYKEDAQGCTCCDQAQWDQM
jgi:hypothetical protein